MRIPAAATAATQLRFRFNAAPWLSHRPYHPHPKFAEGGAGSEPSTAGSAKHAVGSDLHAHPQRHAHSHPASHVVVPHGYRGRVPHGVEVEIAAKHGIEEAWSKVERKAERKDVDTAEKVLETEKKKRWFSRGRLVYYDWEEVPRYLRDNPYIKTMYRSGYTYTENWISLFHLHNESGNIWTHLVAAIAFTVLVCVAFAGSAMVSIVLRPGHGERVLPTMQENPALLRLLLGIMTYLVGAFIYVEKYPERLFPGKFDLFFHSHQIWHVLCVVAAVFHLNDARLTDLEIDVFNYSNNDTVNGPVGATVPSLRGTIEDPSRPSKISVHPQFLPASLGGPYWIVGLSPKNAETGHYEWSIVSGGLPLETGPNGKCIADPKASGREPKGQGLFLLTRERLPGTEFVDGLKQKAEKLGLDVGTLKNVVHEGCRYEI
ncbi:hypothetical protein HDU96_001234 [Phlyctochytrium bullatum]|nr:hypothetical protein HDU96_001234 [Phlyctochytrium bullatum]